MVGGDERVRQAFVESVKVALGAMEKLAAVRKRRGEAAMSEEFRLTGNVLGAIFVRDTSRELGHPFLRLLASGDAMSSDDANWFLSRNLLLSDLPNGFLSAAGSAHFPYVTLGHLILCRESCLHSFRWFLQSQLGHPPHYSRRPLQTTLSPTALF